MTSLLSSETLALLATVQPRAPLFDNLMQAEAFEARHTRGPYKLLPSTAGGYVVFDTRAPLGAGVLSAHRTEEDGDRAIERRIG
jgi:hypothetical protein